MLAAAPEAAGRVVFSGVGKTAAEIDLALKAGILQFNVESEAELALLADAREEAEDSRALCPARQSRCLCRYASVHLNGPARAQIRHRHSATRRELYKSVAKNSWLEAYGVSVHIGSQIRSADPFGAAIERVSKLVKQLEREGIVLKAMDAGGGLGIDYHAGAFDAKAKVDEYAEALEQRAGRV